ncbi:hypothetical protein Cri9333_1418 [Crinalium epipsammum PCC 9333]|uniref:Uncharacterized protein n=1 Tax=Crinalium epipsammum PCC 9333 TaxID=1173022 RepID=K9VXS7_9CYAN|nr:hypothetical protein [Crinalium epipsammum]AFZ12312.1 hypothetical protein Cri9333_1418 [Crinalium epipsammum PCC 9333]
MEQPEDQITEITEIEPTDFDPTFKDQVNRLYRLTFYGRWLVVGILWLSVGSVSLWGLRYPLSLMREYFTWAAVRYGIEFNFLPALGLTLCIATTLAVLIWHTRNVLFGLPQEERQRLEQQVYRIRQQGSSHPLWKWVVK